MDADGEVVVRAEFEADDAVDDLRLGGEHEHGGFAALLAEFAADVEAVLARQHDVEHDEVERAVEGVGEARRAVGSGLDVVAFGGEQVSEGEDEAGLDFGFDLTAGGFQVGVGGGEGGVDEELGGDGRA